MQAIIFSKDNCPFCVKAKKALEQVEASIQEIKLGYDITDRDTFIAAIESKKGSSLESVTVPQIFIDNTYVGGFDKLAELLNINPSDY